VIAQEYIHQGNKTNQVLHEVGLFKSTFYYHPKSGKRGRLASGFTMKQNGEAVPNSEIVSQIESLLLNDFVDYGYQKVTHYLNHQTFIINKKKVYRLMKEHHLLHKKRIKTTGGRQFVRFRKVNPSKPFELLEMDIKYFYVQGEERTVYLLTVIDVFSRKIVGQLLKKSIRKQDVIGLLDEILSSLPCAPSEITIRSDNGSQFIAGNVRTYLKESAIGQEFTHISTPEENGHVEAFHSILERELVTKQEFETFAGLETTLKDYRQFYNEERIHSRIGNQSPDSYLKNYYKSLTGREGDIDGNS
jgi:putative transposase